MAGIHVPKTAPETHQCTTGDAFDHTVRLSGEDDTDWKKNLDFLGVHQKECTHVQTQSTSRRTSRRDPSTPSASVHPGSSSTCTPKTGPSPRTGAPMHGFTPQPTPATPPTRETRPLSEIRDEEFDVPPLFDDLSYEADDVPDLNLDDTDGEPHVGKLYATKQDCQIGLAIYAIKNRFHFRQTRTTRGSFVLSCHDTL